VCRGQRIPDTKDAVTGDDVNQASGAVLYVNHAFQIVANHLLEAELEKLRDRSRQVTREESWCRLIGRIGMIEPGKLSQHF
jgi:hypothetical protein